MDLGSWHCPEGPRENFVDVFWGQGETLYAHNPNAFGALVYDGFDALLSWCERETYLQSIGGLDNGDVLLGFSQTVESEVSGTRCNDLVVVLYDGQNFRRI